MITHSFLPHRVASSKAPDPALQSALGELLHLGLTVARVSARLAEVEERAALALADAAGDAARNVVATPDSLAAANVVGLAADVSDAARDAIAARVASITDSFDKAARAVRRTAALQARLVEGRAFPGSQPRAGGTGADRRDGPHAAGPMADEADEAEQADRPDAPEWGDEIGDQPDADVVRDICRDLEPATRGGSRFGPPLPDEVRATVSRAARPQGPAARPRIVVAGVEPACPAEVLPEPDT